MRNVLIINNQTHYEYSESLVKTKGSEASLLDECGLSIRSNHLTLTILNS